MRNCRGKMKRLKIRQQREIFSYNSFKSGKERVGLHKLVRKVVLEKNTLQLNEKKIIRKLKVF